MGRVTEAILNLIDSFAEEAGRFRSIAFFIASVLRASDFAVPFARASSSGTLTSWMDSMMNGVNLSEGTPSERLAEIGGLLAEALMRLQSRKSSAFPGETGESPLHFMVDQSGHANPVSPEVNA
jgi:hypothetical protein